MTSGAGGVQDESLGVLGEVDYGSDHRTCLQFSYDWRRANSAAPGAKHGDPLDPALWERELGPRGSGPGRGRNVSR